MVKGIFVLLLLTTALICCQFLPLNAGRASTGIVDPCSSSAEFCGPGDGCWFICPHGDGRNLSRTNDEICVCIKDINGNPIPGILASDFWLIGCTDLCLCLGSGSINADSATNYNGRTSFSGTLAAGGWDLTGILVVCQGVIIGCPPKCLSMVVTSPDLNCDGVVNLLDFTIFVAMYRNNLYHQSMDYNCDGVINLVDFFMFAKHYQHSCG